jgi:phosphonate transport system ATP-binding protein
VVTAVLAGRLPQWSLWQAITSLIRPRDADAAYDALARFNLQDKLYARVDRLSGGERRRH